MQIKTFKCAWQDHELQDDKTMTRERAKKLLHAWRNAKRQGIKEFEIKTFRRENVNFYCVKTTKYVNDDSLVMAIYRAQP